MKTLTQNQQNIIDSIRSEFERINSANPKNKSFNLLNVSELTAINDEIKRNREEAEADSKYWRAIAMQEAERVVNLLQQDLPMACVERFGESNGKIDIPAVIIQRKKGFFGHEDYVDFEVCVKKETKLQSHECYYKKGVSLRYNYANAYYDSIEELFAESKIADEIRRKIIR